jgi:hypothetical protein
VKCDEQTKPKSGVHTYISGGHRAAHAILHRGRARTGNHKPLDDGLLRLLAAKKQLIAQQRLAQMIEAARETYDVELAMITCSSVSKEMAEQLNNDFALPVLK